MVQEQDTPLYGEVLNGFDKLMLGFGESRPESDGLRRSRRSAFEKFREMGFPSIKNEDWRYTNIARFLRDEYDLGAGVLGASGAAVIASTADRAAIDSLDCHRIVLVNGRWQDRSSSLPAGLHIFTVAEARQDPTLSAYFERSEEFENHHFTALNAALFSDGLFIRVDPGYVPDKPLHILHIYTADRNLLVQPRHVVLVNRNAALTIIESVLSAEGSSVTGAKGGSSTAAGRDGADAADTAGGPKILVNSLTEIILEQDAQLEHTTIQTPGKGTRVIQHTTVRQRRQSLYNNFTFTLPGSDLVRNELHVRLEEEYAETHLYGLYLTSGRQLVDNHTLVDHQKPSCQSNELYKGVLLEQSTGVFNGKIYVHKDAQKTNAFQQNNNLVISKKATIDSKPQLEIYADDVKCSHGSTVGQFSEEALFYLRSRGIGKDMAKGLLINAFAFDVTEKIRIHALRTHINHLIGDHIPLTGEMDQ
jgi:Fe-S cluster assembly protein SufD